MGTRPHGAQPPSHVAYYVALGGCVLLLVLLTGYLLYFCVSKIVELSECESLTQPTSSRAPRPPPNYPVQPVVREGATAMARLCKQLPAPAASRGGSVFPTSSSPESRQLGPTPTRDPPPPRPPLTQDDSDPRQADARGVHGDKTPAVAPPGTGGSEPLTVR